MTYQHKGFHVSVEAGPYNKVARIYRAGVLVAWTADLATALALIDTKLAAAA